MVRMSHKTLACPMEMLLEIDVEVIPEERLSGQAPAGDREPLFC